MTLKVEYLKDGEVCHEKIYENVYSYTIDRRINTHWLTVLVFEDNHHTWLSALIPDNCILNIHVMF